MEVFIIAEAGVNHNGNIDLAYQLIDKASLAGVDCIKFQTFISEKAISKFAEKASYQKENVKIDESQLEMVKKLELKFEDFVKLKAYAEKKGLIFCSTAFDDDSINFIHSLNIKFWKIPSGEITNLPYIEKIAKYNKPIIMSTGMSDLSEIENTINIIKKYNNNEFILLHCNTEYPTPYCDVNLKAMLTLKEKFDLNIGYSDHTLGIEIPIAAVALGATVIEKHFTLDKNMIGPDHKASLNPQELCDMVIAIRNIEQSLGTGEKKASVSEIENRKVARKSIVALIDIKKGDILTKENLCVKRPGTGISPMKWYQILGTKAKRDFIKDELIEI